MKNAVSESATLHQSGARFAGLVARNEKICFKIAPKEEGLKNGGNRGCPQVWTMLTYKSAGWLVSPDQLRKSRRRITGRMTGRKNRCGRCRREGRRSMVERQRRRLTVLFHTKGTPL